MGAKAKAPAFSLVHQIAFITVASFAIATRPIYAKQIRWEPLDLKSKAVEELAKFAVEKNKLDLKEYGAVVGAWREAGRSTAYIRLKAWDGRVYDAIIDGAFPSMLSFFTEPGMADYVDPTTQQVQALAKNFTATIPRAWNFKVLQAQRKQSGSNETYLLILSPSDLHSRSLYFYEVTLHLNHDMASLEKFILIPVASGAYLNEDPQAQRFQELGRYAANSFQAHSGKHVVFERVISAKVQTPSSFVHYELKMNVLFEGKHHVFQAYLRDNAWSLRSFTTTSLYSRLWNLI